MKQWRILSVLVCIALLAAGCSFPMPLSSPTAPMETQSPLPVESSPPVPVLSVDQYPKVDGSTATIPLGISLMQKITGTSQAIAEESNEYTGTDLSYMELAEHRADLLLVYEAADKTKEALSKYDPLILEPIGRDALVFIVNENNPVDSLTTQQVHDIYTGKITSWNQVGGPDTPIIAFQRPESSGSQTMLNKLIMKDDKMMEAPTEMVAEGMDDIIESISSFDASSNAIGYSVYYYAKNMYTQPGLKFIAIDDVLPSNDTIRSGEYPHTNDFYGAVTQASPDSAKDLLTWLTSDAGQSFIEECGYVPVH